MKLTQGQFNRIIHHSKGNWTTQDIATTCNVSERVVQRVKEAGTWERWPYIVAKTTHGYNTPEYKLYLKRRGLPLTPPPKRVVPNPTRVPRESKMEPTTVPQKSWWRRLFGL